MTEDEAKTKWCPFANSRRIGITIPKEADRPEVTLISYHHGDDNDLTVSCIGSECMAWRKFTALQINARHDEDEWMGYCGLAGKPFTP